MSLLEEDNTKKIMSKIILKSIFYFGIFEFGTSVTINTFLLIFNYPSKFLLLFYYAFYSTLIYYILMLTSLYISNNFFHYLYYVFFVLVAWFYHNTGGFIGLYILNNVIIKLPSILNLIIFIGFGTGLSLLCIYTDNNPKFDVIKLKCDELKGNLNIIQLTDLHLGGSYGKESVELYVKMILNLKEKIDFVVITGDLIDGNIKLSKEMIEPFNLITVPIYFVTGNHEELTWKKEFFDIIKNNSNIIHLKNKIINIDNRVNLIGIDYIKKKHLVFDKLKLLLRDISNSNLPNIFIHHVPIFKPDTLPDYNIFLMLCGHIHGGKAFPFTLIKFFFGRWLTIIIEGLYSFKDKYFVYCCSGLGTSGPNSRCFVGANIGLIMIEGK